MSKLFIFAVGGTGARVLRSLTMLLASGVRIPNCDQVVPVLIDPDTQNGDVTRTVALLKRYARIHEALYGDGQKEKAGFFSQPMNTLAHLNTSGGGEELRDSFVYDFGGISQPFRDYLKYNDLSVESQGLVDLLFTQDSLAANLDVGFRGSPNVGSVVLNAVVQSKEMRYLAQSLQDGDRAFFISSIFGGTGAAGFPLLVKNLRDGNSQLAHPEVRRRMKAGALVMLPYFKLQEPSADEKAAGQDFIDSNTFITKTKTALSYYADNLQGLEAMYYLGDQPGQPLANHPGRAEQRNQAHLLEMLGALSIPHFMEVPDNQLDGNQPLFHEYGLKSDTADVDFGQLPSDLRQEVARPLIQLHYFARYFLKHTPDDAKAPYYEAGGLAAQLRNNRALRELYDFFWEYNEWIRELGVNQRRYTAIRAEEMDFNKMVADKTVETGIFSKGITPGYFRDELTKAVGKDTLKNPTENEALRWVVKAFEEATGEILDKKLQYS